MSLFNVYPLFDVDLVKAQGHYVYDNLGQKYLDLYGGHAVISIGHSHPDYVEAIQNQVTEIGFYSNSVINQLQKKYSQDLARISGYSDYHLFMVNSGAEATENALKLASFHTGKSRVIAFKKAFHGRTTGAVATTDNPRILPAFGQQLPVTFVELNDSEAVETELKKGDVSAVIIEGIQGVAGINIPQDSFLQELRKLTTEYETILILDEVQSGFGRTGKFFAHQYAEIQADIICCAKGMGNGFPVGGILISPKFQASFGLLGTTFGGNHLACAAAQSVLEVIEKEDLLRNALKLEKYIRAKAQEILSEEQIKGRGLMIGFDLKKPIKEIRSRLVYQHHIFTGSSGDPNVIRLLPALNIQPEAIDTFFNALQKELNHD